MDGPAFSQAFLFLLTSFVFAGIAGYLIMQVIGHNLEVAPALLFYLPIFACWAAMSHVDRPQLQVPMMALAFTWCGVIVLRTRAVNSGINRRLSEERIKECLDWLHKHPNDGEMRFRLAEAYEERGWNREAYQEYAAAAQLDGRNKRARIRARELYQKVTGKAMPEMDLPTAPPMAGSVTTLPSTAALTTALPSTSGGATTVVDAGLTAPEWTRKAEQHLAGGNIPGAIEAYRRALALDPGSDRYRTSLFGLMESEPDTTSHWNE